MSLRARLSREIERIEGMRINPFQWVLIFLSIVIARNFLEQFGPEKIVFNFPSFFLHFPFAYIAPVLALSILLALLARERVERVTRLMLVAWFLTLIPPLIDLVLGKGAGSRIGYLYLEKTDVARIITNFFNPAVRLTGTTPGIRIEAFLGCVLSCVYVFLKTRAMRRTILTLFAIYLSFLFFFTLPYTFINILSSFSPEFGDIGSVYFQSGLFLKSHIDKVAYSIALLDLLLILVLLMFWMRLYSREMLIALFKGLKGFEPVHYCLAALFGMVLAAMAVRRGGTSVHVHPFDVFTGISLILSVLCAFWVGSALKERKTPEVTSGFSILVIFALAMLLSGLVSYSALVFCLTFLAFLSLYYAGPFGLHRFFPFSTILIALATLSCVLLGFCMAAGVLAPQLFPRPMLFAVLVSCFCGFVAKDYVGGRRRGRQAAAFLLIVGFAIVGIILRSAFLIWAGAALGVCVAVFLLLRVEARLYLIAAYGVFAAIIALMTLRSDLPAAVQEGFDIEQVASIEKAKEFQIGRMYEESAIEFEKAISAGWKDAETFFALGFAYEEMGKLDKSAECYGAAVLEDSTYVQGYNNLGSVLRSLGQFDSSETVLRRGMKKDPGSARMIRNFSLTLFDEGKFDKLIPILTRYLKTNPMDYRMREMLADAYMQESIPDSAETEYRKVLGSKTGYVPAIVGLGYIMANRGNAEEAEKYLLVALQLDSTNVDAMHRLAYMHLERGDADGAIALFREIVSLEPLVANHYDSLGDAYMKAGSYREARAAYEMALELDSAFAHPREMLERLENQ